MRDVRTGAVLSPEDAAARISAYVYGNMVVLAALASLSQDAMTSGHAALVVAGVAASTFLAHAVADGIGRRLRSPHRLTTSQLVAELRDSVPVLSAAILPVLLLAFTAWSSIPGVWAQGIAGLYLVIRLGLIGALVARYRGVPSSRRTVLAGLTLAALGALITVIKVTVGH
ncbi:hypothetical protein ASF89_02175 [Frigoribacterium sp. Leaf172]|nr:hypothetical protein ASF89_02175 [Frigoribacterium sp. Leaf172]